MLSRVLWHVDVELWGVMTSAESNVPNARASHQCAGSRGSLVGKSWPRLPSFSGRSIVMASALLMSCALLQGCVNQETNPNSQADLKMAPANMAPASMAYAKNEIRVSRIIRTAYAPEPTGGDSFEDRFRAVTGFMRKADREPIRGRAGPIPGSYQVASLSPEVPYVPSPVTSAQTHLIGFDNSAFPYNGSNPGGGRDFSQGRRYQDNRVLVHIPTGFDVRQPGVIVVFFHGHGATLARDVRDRQLLPKQITESGVNAVLVAPQLAYNAADSSAGKFWERGGLKRFMSEAADQLAKVYGDPSAAATFNKMPVVIVAYSGGYVTAAWSLKVGGLGSRVRGVVLLDALYGEIDKFASWITRYRRSAFFISAYTRYTKRRDDQLVRILRDRHIVVRRNLNGPLRPGTIAFLPTGEGIRHRDYVTQAWTDHPITDILVKMASR